MLDLAYGSDASERLDVFTPKAPGAPVLVYIHGGYWRALDKRDQSFVAPPFVAAGAMVVLPNYALCPAVTIEHIVLQIVASLAWVWRHAAEHGGDRSRIVVAGHSAGGHLAAMMLACDWRAVAPDLPADLVKGALAVSGVFELEPLRHAPFLAPDIGLDAARAKKLSPAAMPAPKAASSPSSAAMKARSSCARTPSSPSPGAQARCRCPKQVPGRHHMNVLHELADPQSRTHRLGLRLLGLVSATV